MLEDEGAVAPVAAAHGDDTPVAPAVGLLGVVVVVDHCEDEGGRRDCLAHMRTLRAVDNSFALLVGVGELEELGGGDIEQEVVGVVGGQDGLEEGREQGAIRPLVDGQSGEGGGRWGGGEGGNEGGVRRRKRR